MVTAYSKQIKITKLKYFKDLIKILAKNLKT